MDFQEIKKRVKKSWHWVWHSDSAWSWVVALVIIFIGIKFIFLPTISLTFGTSLPIAGVESSSMDHQIIEDDYNRLSLCDKIYTKQTKEHLNFDEYWNVCGHWYEDKEITKEQFSKFPMKNGFKKGDIIIVWGRFAPEIGDIIIFNTNYSHKSNVIKNKFQQ